GPRGRGGSSNSEVYTCHASRSLRNGSAGSGNESAGGDRRGEAGSRASSGGAHFHARRTAAVIPSISTRKPPNRHVIFARDSNNCICRLPVAHPKFSLARVRVRGILSVALGGGEKPRKRLDPSSDIAHTNYEPVSHCTSGVFGRHVRSRNSSASRAVT